MFSKKKKQLTPTELREQVRGWKRGVQSEVRTLDRTMRGIDREIEKTKKEIKKVAKAGDRASCKILAKEMLNAQNAKNRIMTSKAQMNSVCMQLDNQVALIKVSGCIEKSSEVMKSMNELVKLPELQANMRDMSKEMMKAGMIEDMVDDTMSMMDPADLDEQADAHVDKVLFEITEGVMGSLPEAEKQELEKKQKQEEEEKQNNVLEARYQALLKS
eukprot:CAMPEP_0115005538 /NCGR_PEP_ID=MMETSP0216-20121206/19934_1 /TAXON_ID=223996 /ORGANISM="Protocruzia adherens, Strain Boccale" /LENGTH=215 /DNA_ID=CAMNT_0002371889 /DNA_START=96 /DNA_END=743 /DNA_ORIENTATION=-